MTPRLDLSRLRKAHAWELALRFTFGGLVTVGTGLVAHRWGPSIGGLFLAFPSILPASLTLTKRHDGRRDAVDDVFVHPTVAGYALDIVAVVRTRSNSQQPISPRAALGTVRLAKAHALASSRDHVRPDDIQAVVVPALSHRIVDATNDDLVAARSWIGEFLRQVPVPPTPGA